MPVRLLSASLIGLSLLTACDGAPPPEPEPGEVTAPWPAPPRPVNPMTSPSTAPESPAPRAEPRPPATQDGWDGRWLVVAALVIVVLSGLFMAKY